jgi:hypothetical protein
MTEQEASEQKLPPELIQFLRNREQLQYDPEPCEAGAITLHPLTQLKLERFPVETSGSDDFEQDPHYPEVNSYLVPGINLVASCTGDYDPEGLLLWLPVEKRYGVWDPSHCAITMFGPEVTWDQIVAAPAAHINAGWWEMDGESPPVTFLVPWPNHPYSDAQVHTPQPA